MTKVSICIPTYNSGRFLCQTLDSTLGQTYTDYEVILCDDCSQDDTRQLIAGYSNPRMRLVFDGQRRGLVGNWNRCLDEATGTYVTLLNHDDLMRRDNVAEKVEMLDAHPDVGFVFSGIEHINSAGATLGGHWTPDALPATNTTWAGQDFLSLLLARGNIVPASSVVMRRSLVHEVGGFDARLYFTLDLEMWMRLSLRAGVGYLAQPLVHLRRHEQQVTSGFIDNGRDVEQVWRAIQIVLTEQRELIDQPQTAFELALNHMQTWTRALARQALRRGRWMPAATYVRQYVGFRRLESAGLLALTQLADPH